MLEKTTSIAVHFNRFVPQPLRSFLPGTLASQLHGGAVVLHFRTLNAPH